MIKFSAVFVQFFLTIAVCPDKIDEVWYTLPLYVIGVKCFIINRRNGPGDTICIPDMGF